MSTGAFLNAQTLSKNDHHSAHIRQTSRRIDQSACSSALALAYISSLAIDPKKLSAYFFRR